MMYLISPMESHPDNGFGIVAMQFYDLAKKCVPKDGSLEHLPVNFLYRHSCELYLKSLIVLLKIRFSPETKNAEEIISKISNEHSIEALFKEVQEMYLSNKATIDELTDVDWKPEDNLEKAVRKIVGYDDGSTYFRYPISRDRQKDKKKDNSKEINPKKLQSLNSGKPGKYTVVLNQDEEVVKVFEFGITQDKNITTALSQLAEYLHCFHIAVRMRLYNGR